MLERIIMNAIKKIDGEVTEVKIKGDAVSITYSDGDHYTGEIRLDDTVLILDFHRTFIIRLNLSVI